MQMGDLDIVHIFLGAVSRMAHIPDHIPRGDHAAFLQPFRIGVILPQMGVIIVSLPVKTADSDAPSAVLIPSQCFYRAGFNTHNRCTHQAHHIMSQMSSLISIAAADAKIIIMCIVKSPGQRKITFQPILAFIMAIPTVLLIFSHQPADGGVIGVQIIRIVLQFLRQFLQGFFAFGESLGRLFHGL